MRPRLFILLFLPVLLLMYAPAGAQSGIDSLQTLLAGNPPDTVKIDNYLSLHQALIDKDSAQSIAYLRKATALSKKINDKKRLSMSYLDLGKSYSRKGDLDKAFEILPELEKLLPELKNPEIEAKAYLFKGTINTKSGNYELAITHLFKALGIFGALENQKEEGRCLLNIGNVYLHLNDYDKTISSYEKALEKFEAVGYEEGIASVTGNMGIIYRRKEEYDLALKYINRSLAVNQKLNRKESERIDLHNIGTIYFKWENFEQAKKYFELAKKLSAKIDSKRGLIYAYHSLAVVEANQNNFDKAFKNLDSALVLAVYAGMKDRIKDIYESYALNYEDTGQWKLALDYRKKHESLKDSILNENTFRQINELQVKYETAKKNEEIATLSKENEARVAEAERRAIWNRVLIGGLILVAVIAGLVVFLLRQRFKNQQLMAAKNEEIKTARFKQQLSELEMKALRVQMNPHFIFNCMNSINRMILGKDADNASKYLTKFSKLIRLMLENSEKPTASLQDELAMLEAYIQLEALRFKEKISYRISVDDNIDQENTQVPSMVLQPFIENAIWHGLMHKDGGGLINVSISEDNDVLRCVIEDNGVGRKKALELQGKTVMRHQSMGLKITEERLRLLNSRELQELIRITDLKDSVNRALGTRVDISIPIA